MVDFNYCILFISKNDYSLIEYWLQCEYSKNLPLIINLDIGSTEVELEKGRQLCLDYNIEFLVTNRTEMQLNLEEVFLKSKRLIDFDYLLYLHTDCFKIDEDVYLKIRNLINNNYLHNFGCIGFNIYHDDEIHLINSDDKLMTTGRGVLQRGNGYYNSKSLAYNNKFRPYAFPVESVMWCAVLLSKRRYLESIIPDVNFNFFHAFDDIAYQFMIKGFYNIAIPTIRFKHDQSVKQKFGFNKKSPLGKKNEVIKKYGRIDHLDVWYNKYGFHWDLKKTLLFPKIDILYKILSKILKTISRKTYLKLNTVSRKEFIKSKSNKSLILMEFYKSNNSNIIKEFNDIKV